MLDVPLPISLPIAIFESWTAQSPAEFTNSKHLKKKTFCTGELHGSVGRGAGRGALQTMLGPEEQLLPRAPRATDDRFTAAGEAGFTGPIEPPARHPEWQGSVSDKSSSHRSLSN